MNGDQETKIEYAAIRSYEERMTCWSTHCEECGGVIDAGYSTATAAREAWDRLRALEGRALCDTHWIDPDEDSGVRG